MTRAPVALSEEGRRLLEAPNLAHVATIMKDGSPQVSPVWVDYDGQYVLINSAEGRQKVLNLRRDSRVALSVADPQSLARRVLIRGRVVEMTHEGAWESIDKLAKKYTGRESYGRRDGEQRVLIKIEPLRVNVSGR
jgi:PPOX class probable F420-dependent enzyme